MSSTTTLSPPIRPKFNSHVTSDRLREGAGLRLPPFALRSSNIRKGRTSIFREEMGFEEAPCWGSDSYLVVPDEKYSTNVSPSIQEAAEYNTLPAQVVLVQGGSGKSEPRAWYTKLATRSPIGRRTSSQGQIVPSVTVSTTEA